MSSSIMFKKIIQCPPHHHHHHILGFKDPGRSDENAEKQDEEKHAEESHCQLVKINLNICWKKLRLYALMRFHWNISSMALWNKDGEEYDNERGPGQQSKQSTWERWKRWMRVSPSSPSFIRHQWCHLGARANQKGKSLTFLIIFLLNTTP